MQLRNLGRSGLRVSVIGLGCNNFGGRIDLEASRRVVDRAIEQKLDDALASGVPEPLTTRDLLAAAKAQKPTTAEWFATAKNFVLYANDAGLYDDLKDHLRL